MYISLSRLTGMPVVWQDRQMGYVERAEVDDELSHMCGVVVRKGIGTARWVSCDNMLLADSRCVRSRVRPGRVPACGSAQRRQVYLHTGQCAGEVTDLFIRADTFRVAALEVCQGPLYRLAGQRAYAPGFSVGMNGMVTAHKLLSWAQLVKQLGEEDDG